METPGQPKTPARTWSYWARKLLVCNPFYLVSAGLLLYGFYLVSSDVNFPGKDVAQLGFNFGSLQLYELLLASTAVLLARRHIWYDSNLLVFLENGLVLVPFILLCEATLLISPNVVRVLCAVACAMAVVRFGGLKRMHRSLNLPGGFLAIGLVLLAVNVTLLLVFRTLHESKVGTKPTDGPAFEMNQYSWLLILPAIIALANLLPRPGKSGELLPERRWIPTGLFTLWIAASTVHLYCLGYVYNFDWEVPFLIPPLWALAWTIWNRHADFFPTRWLRPALLVAPALVTLIAVAHPAPILFVVLTGLNILGYSLILAREPNRMALHLLVVSLAALGLGFVKIFDTRLPEYLNAGNCTLAFITVYLCCWISVSRNPKLGILGAIILGTAVGNLFSPWFAGPHLGIQAGFAFLLLHSLLWQDEDHPGARGGRIFACALWGLHSLFLVLAQWPHAVAALTTAAALILCACGIAKLLRGHWPPVILPMTAALVLLLHPGTHAAVKTQSMPVGLWVVAGSFLLFAAGTLTALTRSKWNPPAQAASATSAPGQSD